jgi:hypothetical protein
MFHPIEIMFSKKPSFPVALGNSPAIALPRPPQDGHEMRPICMVRQGTLVTRCDAHLHFLEQPLLELTFIRI